MDIYDRQGNPMSHDEWAVRASDHEYKRVALTESPEPPITVSTVWLGLDHGYGRGPPIIFETMVFGFGDDEIQERYATIEEAIKGHEQIVHQVFGPLAEMALVNTFWNIAGATL